MKFPKISIGILNYNGQNYLKKILTPLSQLDYPNYEIVIVDNGSTDCSLDFLKNKRSIKLIKNKKNLGYGTGKNLVVKNCSGKYILLLDNDILVKNKKILHKLLEFYNSKKNISFLSIPLFDLSINNPTTHYGLFYSSIKKSIDFNKLIKIKYYPVGGYIGGIVFFKKDIFFELGGYDEKYPFNLDDYDLSARSQLFNKKIYIFTERFAIHLGIEKRSNINAWCWKNKFYLCGFNRMILKNYNFYNVLIWIPLSFIWIFYKTILRTYQSKSFKPLLSYLISLFYFFKDLPDTLKQRKIIQSKRVVKEDIFLKIKPPKFG